MKNKRDKDFEKLLRNNMECRFCGRELNQVSKRTYRKWDLGAILLQCKQCKKEEK